MAYDKKLFDVYGNEMMIWTVTAHPNVETRLASPDIAYNFIRNIYSNPIHKKTEFVKVSGVTHDSKIVNIPVVLSQENHVIYICENSNALKELFMEIGQNISILDVNADGYFEWALYIGNNDGYNVRDAGQLKLFDVIGGDVKIYFVSSLNGKSYCENQDNTYKKIKEMNWPRFEFQSVQSCGSVGIMNKLSSLIIYNRASGVLRIFDSMSDFSDQLDYYCDTHSIDDIYIIDVDADGNFIARYTIDTSVKYAIWERDDYNKQIEGKPNRNLTENIIQSIIDGDTTRVELTVSGFPFELIHGVVTKYFINAKVSYDCIAKEYTIVFTLEE